MGFADLIQSMADAGAPIEAIVLAVKAIEDGSSATKKGHDRQKGAERQARYRARLAGKSDDDIPSLKAEVTTSSDAEVTKGDAVTRPPNDNISNPPSSLRSETPRAREDWFSEFWSAYPKRTGANPKQPALERFCRLLKAADDPDGLAQAVIDGARRYAASVSGEDPRFTAQAVTWLNQKRWLDDHSSPENGLPRASPSSPPRNAIFAALDRSRSSGGRNSGFAQPDGSTVIPPGEEIVDPFIRAGVRKYGDRPTTGAASAAAGMAAVVNALKEQR